MSIVLICANGDVNLDFDFDGVYIPLLDRNSLANDKEARKILDVGRLESLSLRGDINHLVGFSILAKCGMQFSVHGARFTIPIPGSSGHLIMSLSRSGEPDYPAHGGYGNLVFDFSEHIPLRERGSRAGDYMEEVITKISTHLRQKSSDIDRFFQSDEFKQVDRRDLRFAY